MNKKFLKHYMETEPEGTSKKYIFLVDNQDIAMNIVMSGYQALYLGQEDDGYYFSVNSFIEDMRSIQFHGTCQSAYHYVTACTTKWMNDRILEFCKEAGLDGKAGWQLFKEKEYLGKLDNQPEVGKALEQFILEFQKRTHSLKMEKQRLFFENHEMQEEMQKSNAEIQQMTEELSEMRKLNQSLQQSNDDLRNRNGLMRRNEQEQLEKEIKDVRDRNSKLVMQVNQSSVEAVEQEKKKQEEAEKQARQAEYQIEREKNRADMEIQRARRKAKSEIADMKENQFFWDWGYLCVIFFSFLQNGAFQQDVLQLIMIPINWCKEYIAWFERLEYISDTAEEMLFKGFFSMLMITAGILGCVFLVWVGVEQYKKIWDDLYKMVLIFSISFVAVLGNLIREYLPLNLILVILFINIGTILLRAYLKKKYPQMYD